MHFRFILVDFCDNILMFRSKFVKNTKKICFFISSVGLSVSDTFDWSNKTCLAIETYLKCTYNLIQFFWDESLGVFTFFFFLKSFAFCTSQFSVKHFNGPQLQFPSYKIFMIYWMFSQSICNSVRFFFKIFTAN